MRRGLTYLDEDALYDLSSRAREAERSNRQGVFIEAGCALGGSSIVIAHAKGRTRPFYVYDVFGTIPEPSARDGPAAQKRYEQITDGSAIGPDGGLYYGYRSDLLSEVASSFEIAGLSPETHNVVFVEGLFEETLYPPGPVALAHIDCDWYESVKICLDRIWPALIHEGVIVIDDYDHWEGCRIAIDEFIGRTPDCRPERLSRLHLVKDE
jgi:hypothetical protein